MHTERVICCQWCRHMQYFLISRKNNPWPPLPFYFSSLCLPNAPDPNFFLSALNDLAFACMLYQTGDDQKVSVSDKTRQCVHVTHQYFIHQGVRLIYKVPSLTIVSEPAWKS